MRTFSFVAVASVCGLSQFAASPASAHQVATAELKKMCAEGYVGPRTVYGETKAESAAKKVMYDWYCLAIVNGKAKEAFEKYVSKDICDHSHMMNAGLKACGGYDEMLGMFSGMGAMMSKGTTMEFPLYATVNGDLVTQYGEGVDIFRVNAQGKITDHWDASPPKDVTLKAHDQGFSDRMQQQIDTGKRAGPPGGAGGPGAGGPGAGGPGAGGTPMGGAPAPPAGNVAPAKK
jgi:predicted SnoaL-like aldol condensation-catalyzing enzyme